MRCWSSIITTWQASFTHRRATDSLICRCLSPLSSESTQISIIRFFSFSSHVFIFYFLDIFLILVIIWAVYILDMLFG